MDKKTTRAKQDIKERKSGSSRVVYFFPFLFSLFPVTAMLSVNAGQVPVTAGWCIALGCLALAAVIILAVQAILKHWLKASLVTSLILALLFSYGHIYGALEDVTIGNMILGSNQVLLPLYSVMLVAGLIGILRIKEPGKQFGIFLNLFSVCLMIIPIIKLSIFTLQINAAQEQTAVAPLTLAAKPYADVFFIVLDGYDRSDTLLKQYGYDNSAFLTELESQGFVVPRCAQSNFAWTPLSMSTTFQMDYLDKQFEELKPKDSVTLHAVLANLIQNNPVRDLFDRLGYEVIAFENGYFFTEWPDADYFYSFSQGKEYTGLTMFEGFFIRYSTILRAYTGQFDSFVAQVRTGDDLSAPVKYNQVMFTLDTLDQIAQHDGPKFVYAHVMAPHSPWVIGPNGDVDYQGMQTGYPNEVTYINKRLLVLVDEIIKSSPTPPIIIIQSDHGWEWEGRLANLNALYLPGGVGSQVTDDWTPVNTFRLIFREYFGLDYPMLPNRSYISPIEARMDLSPAPMTCPD